MICKDNVKNRTAAGNPVFYILSSLSYLLSLLFKKSGPFKEEPEDVWLVLTSSILNVSGIFVTFLGCIVSVAAVWLLLLLIICLPETVVFVPKVLAGLILETFCLPGNTGAWGAALSSSSPVAITVMVQVSASESSYLAPKIIFALSPASS